MRSWRNYLLLWRGRHRESDREETSAESPGNSETHMVLSWYGGSEWHMNESGSLFHCACLICPLSFLHQPIFSDTTAPPPSSRLAATCITLTNQGLQSFFALRPPLTTNSPRWLSPSGFDVIPSKASWTRHPPVVCLNSPACPFRVHKTFFLTLSSPYAHRFSQPFSSPNYTPRPPCHQPPVICRYHSFVLRSWAYWRVTLEWASVRFCVCT